MKSIDYDAARQPVVELGEDSIEELKAHRATQSPVLDIDEVDLEENFELPGADLSGEELTVAVVPMRGDEFRCSRCFLVRHRSQFAMRRGSEDICLECV